MYLLNILVVQKLCKSVQVLRQEAVI